MPVTMPCVLSDPSPRSSCQPLVARCQAASIPEPSPGRPLLTSAGGEQARPVPLFEHLPPVLSGLPLKYRLPSDAPSAPPAAQRVSPQLSDTPGKTGGESARRRRLSNAGDQLVPQSLCWRRG